MLVSRTAADIEAAKAKITSQYNFAARCFPLDLSDSKSVDILAAECPETDLLVNNAGAIPRGNIAKVDEARWAHRLGSEGLRLCQYDPALLCLDGGAQ